MRRALTVLLAILIIGSVLVGCAPATSTPGATSATTTPGATSAPTTSGATSATTATPVPKEPLKLTAINSYNVNPDAPKDDTLIKLTHENYKKIVGRDVIIEFQNYPTDGTILQYLQMVDNAGTMPDIIEIYDTRYNAEAMDYAIERGLFQEFTKDTLVSNFPNFAERVVAYGATIDDVMTQNVYKDKAGNSKLWYLPTQFTPAVFPTMRDPASKMSIISGQTYNMALRDDILKQIFPSAKTEAELQALYLEKGSLTMDDIAGDIPIKNMDDMLAYFRKVKELNIKVGDKTVIPAAPSSSACSESVGSMSWSMQSILGVKWNYPLILQDPPQNSYFMFTSPQWKSYAKWWNTIYSEKLVDPEFFIMKDDQYQAKAINGEYAVMNAWLPVAKAREVGVERGYGFRILPMFYPFDFTNFNNRFAYASLTTRGVYFSTKIKSEELADVYKWADYQMSETADSISAWGSPDWYTGEGKDRRYKAEYKDLENWAVYGTPGEKDGLYYGITACKTVDFSGGNNRQLEINPFSLVQPADSYPMAPSYVYTKDNKEQLAKASLDAVVNQAIWDYFNENAEWYNLNGWQPSDLNTPKWTAYDNSDWTGTAKAPWVKAITEDASKFDANYADFIAAHNSLGMTEGAAECVAKLVELWPIIQANKVAK